jgi:hypothetical protein
MKINTKPAVIRTHEGAPARRISSIDELRRTTLACLLWESGFYESGEAVADRIKRLVPLCDPTEVAELAIKVREEQHLRHVPLLLVRELARDSSRCPAGLISNTLYRVIRRADELAEFLALYWADKRQPLSKQVKKGLALAFGKFSEYALAKYNRNYIVKLRDVLFLSHAKPKDEAQAALWKRLVDGTLATPDTWEVSLSAGGDKKEVFERMLSEGKLGYLALLRNLRNMQQANVRTDLIFNALSGGARRSKVLPFRFLAAARAVPAWEAQLDEAMQLAINGLHKLHGNTVVLVDVSGSMRQPLSAKSDLSRLDAAAALAVLICGVCSDARVFRFEERAYEVPARKGMALVGALGRPEGGTMLGQAVIDVRRACHDIDRLIVVTDEQSDDMVGSPGCRGYMINVATDQNGVRYGDWTRINGFSESVVSYISEIEA